MLFRERIATVTVERVAWAPLYVENPQNPGKKIHRKGIRASQRRE